jgi:hypothetical protein
MLKKFIITCILITFSVIFIVVIVRDIEPPKPKEIQKSLKVQKDVLASLPECEGSPLQIKFFELTESERKIEQQKEKITDTWTECRGTKNTLEWSGYSGGWLNGEKHYSGFEWNADGETYEGGFKNGKKHGFAVEKSQGELQKVGEYKNGQFRKGQGWEL